MSEDPRSPWEDVLDSVAAQVDLQAAALRRGTPAPADLEVEPPDEPLSPVDRQRAIALFERCEDLLDEATTRIVDQVRRPRSPYRVDR